MIRILSNEEMGSTDEQEAVYELAPGHTPIVEDGQMVEIGTPLTTGACDPRQILTLQGREATARSLVSDVQRVYHATGVSINDKHIEVIVRQMLRTVQITEPGETALPGDLMDRFSFIKANAAILEQGGAPARARPVLLGLTRTALRTASWIAAASF